MALIVSQYENSSGNAYQLFSTLSTNIFVKNNTSHGVFFIKNQKCISLKYKSFFGLRRVS